MTEQSQPGKPAPSEPATPTEPREMTEARHTMVEKQLLPRGIADPRVIQAMKTTPRHLFLPPQACPLPYGAHPLPIPAAHTTSQPSLAAILS